MDFFAEQARARRQTRRMVAALVGAMTVLGAGLGMLVSWAVNASNTNLSATAIGAWVAGAFVGVTLAASGWRYWRLRRQGGPGVAIQLGGHLLLRPAASPAQARALNIVDEMAIAAGMPPPDLYLLPSPAINAFAAGFDPMDAVIGLTQGALDQLDRAELQAVIAHEFSHILHGDVRLNSRFTGLAFGLTMVADMGRASLYGRRRGGVIGIAMLLIGGLGSFLARWVQAGVSRQREYLADATAAQLTRNPKGLAQALNRVRWHRLSVDTRMPEAGEHRHIFFSDPD